MMTESDDRISATYYSNSYDTREHYSWMFQEDLHKNLVPIAGGRLETVKCILEPPNQDFEKELGNILPTYRSHYRHTLNETVLGTLQLIAQHLVMHGYLVLELVKYRDFNKREFYKLEPIHGHEVIIKKNEIIQIVHEDAAKRLNITKPIKIPIDKCYIIEFPKSMGGKDQFLKFVDEFRKLGGKSPMMNFLKNPLQGKSGYDISKHQRLHELELWKKSKVFYWNHRGNYDNLFSGYYFFYRSLQFRKIKIALRDYIIQEMKVIISQLSQEFGLDIQLQITGLLTAAKIEEALKKWESGEFDINKMDEIYLS